MKAKTGIAASIVIIAVVVLAVLARGVRSPSSATPDSQPSSPTNWATNFQTPTPQPAFFEAPPPFVGDLSGYHIDVTAQGRTPFDACPGVGLNPPPPGQAIATVSVGPLRIEPSRLPASLTATDPPEVFLCRGEVAQVGWTFHIAPGSPNANAGGGSAFISRVRGLAPIQHGASQAQWTAVTVGGLPAVLARPAATIGSCFVAVYQPETDVLTTVQAAGAEALFCMALVEAAITQP
jgi:hypothetical protein